MSQFLTRKISNKYLGVSRVIKARNSFELNSKVAKQLQQWKEREKKERQKALVSDLKALAEINTREAQDNIEAFRSILRRGLQTKQIIHWESLYDQTVFKEPPTLEAFFIKYNVPREEKLIEFFLPFIKRNRLELIEKANSDFKLEVQKYLKDRESFYQEQKEHNDRINTFKSNFESGMPEAVVEYIEMILEQSTYPEYITKTFLVQFEESSDVLVVDYDLPTPNQIPKTTEFKFVSTRKTIEPKEMKQKDFQVYYEDITLQIAFRTIHEVFDSTYNNKIKHVVFNGWVDGIDSSTGTDFRSCIVSLQMTNAQYRGLNLERINPRDCFRKLKGVHAGILTELVPIKPVLQLNKDDSRFVETRDVLAELHSIPNLAAMEWEDFEHLISELFNEMFSERGGEVVVTRKIRDLGVDAVVFDEDPLLGGKYIIQAKRYNNIVPPSAVRELYGTMSHENASKGFLVTTGWFGPESYEWAKDKPIKLIDGNELIGMLSKLGQTARIDYTKKRKR